MYIHSLIYSTLSLTQRVQSTTSYLTRALVVGRQWCGGCLIVTTGNGGGEKSDEHLTRIHSLRGGEGYQVVTTRFSRKFSIGELNILTKCEGIDDRHCCLAKTKCEMIIGWQIILRRRRSFSIQICELFYIDVVQRGLFCLFLPSWVLVLFARCYSFYHGRLSMIQLRSRASFCISVFYSVIQKIDSAQGLVNIPFLFSPFFWEPV